MNRQQKASLIESLKNDFSNASASFLVGVQGLSVSQIQQLRREVATKGGKLKVAKNRLARLAISEASGVTCEIEDHLKNQLGIIFADKEFTQVAKILSDYSKNNPQFNIVAGCLESQVIDRAKIMQLALLPSKDILLAQLCGTLKAPIAQFTNVLNVLVLRLLWTLKEVEKAKQ